MLNFYAKIIRKCLFLFRSKKVKLNVLSWLSTRFIFLPIEKFKIWRKKNTQKVMFLI